MEELMEEIKTHFIETYGEEYMSHYFSYETYAVSSGTTDLDQFISYFRNEGKTLSESLGYALQWIDYCFLGSTSEINVEERNNGVEDMHKLVIVGNRVYKQRWLTHPDSNYTS